MKEKPKMSGDQGQATTEVREAFSQEKLANWMVKQSEITALLQPSTIINLSSRLTVSQFGFGQSNPTYKIEISNVPKISMVLRKKPMKVAHKSAHALHREFRVLKSLQQHNMICQPNAQVPVPTVYAYCKDEGVLGSEFYLMEFVKGRIFTDPSLPGLSVAERQIAFANIVQVLANLHLADYRAIGLENYGGGSDSSKKQQQKYVERQLERLVNVSRQQAKLSGEPAPEIEQLASLLSKNAPHCPEKSTSLLHGDFKVDNLIFHPTQPRVLAILDWELSTIGDPLSDVANLSMMYYAPRNMVGIMGLGDLNLIKLGIPSRKELVKAYCQYVALSRKGHEVQLSFETVWQWSGFYLAFLFFKNCVIVQGVAQRAKAGTASSANAKLVAKMLPLLVQTTQKILKDQPPPQSKSRL